MNTVKQINLEIPNINHPEKDTFTLKNNLVLTSRQRSLLILPLGIALYFIAPSPTFASMVGGWWGGTWTCKIDGRPARMKWSAVDDSKQTCNDDGICSSTSGARWKGSFSDNGSPWVELTDPQEKKGGVFFRHADGNKWYLPKPVGNKTSGYTTWDGKRYPLSCWK